MTSGIPVSNWSSAPATGPVAVGIFSILATFDSTRCPLSVPCATTLKYFPSSATASVNSCETLVDMAEDTAAYVPSNASDEYNVYPHPSVRFEPETSADNLVYPSYSTVTPATVDRACVCPPYEAYSADTSAAPSALSNT